MRRDQLEHIIRAAAVITDQQEFVVIGSSSLLASVPDPPEALQRTRDVDIYPLRAPELADVIEGAIGELSAFEERFSYYAQGVGPNTARLPEGWEGRLVRLQGRNTNHAIAHCLEPHDLAASKLVAHRDKDMEFVEELLRHRIIASSILCARVDLLPEPEPLREQLKAWVISTAERLGQG